MIDKIRRGLVLIKVYVTRMSSYISLLNTFMIVISLLVSLKTYGLNIDITKNLIYILPTLVIAIIFGGYLEYNLIFKTELDYTQGQNPRFEEIMRELNEIKQKMVRE